MHLAPGSSLAASAAFPRPENLTTFAEHLPRESSRRRCGRRVRPPRESGACLPNRCGSSSAWRSFGIAPSWTSSTSSKLRSQVPARSRGHRVRHPLPAQGLPTPDAPHIPGRWENYPASDLAELYQSAGKSSSGTTIFRPRVLEREEAIRSKSFIAVAQEFGGILLAYNLVRLEMERVADEAGVGPTRISFIAALHLVCDEWLWSAVAKPGAIPKHLRNLRGSSPASCCRAPRADISACGKGQDERLPAQAPVPPRKLVK